jgi:hypothetical protein
MVGTRVLYQMAVRRSDQIGAVDRLPAAGSGAVPVHSVRMLEKGSRIPIYSHGRGPRHPELGGHMRFVNLFGKGGTAQKSFSIESK